MRGDYLRVERTFDTLLDIVENRKEDAIAFFLSDVEPLHIDVSYDSVYDPESAYLTPIDLKVTFGISPDLSSDEVERRTVGLESITKRIPKESKVGGVARFRNLLSAVRGAMGDSFRSNIFIRKMKHYHQFLGGGEPFVESFDLRITEVERDSMAATRFHILLEAAHLSHQKNYATRLIPDTEVPLLRAYEEVVDFIFQSPWVNTLALKKVLGLFKQMTFSRTTRGDALHWNKLDENPVLHGFEIRPVRFNDSAVYNINKPALAEDADKLKEMNLPYLRLWFIKMLTARVDEDTTAMASDLSFIESVAGFFRGNEFKAHVKQVEKSPPLPEGEPLFKEDLIGVWKEALTAVLNKLPSYERYLARIPGFMTTKSSGGYRVEWTVRTGDGERRVVSSDKVLNFLSDPDKFLDPELVASELSEENPAPIFSREVVARDVRAVFAIPLGSFCVELVIGPDLLFWQSRQAHFTLAKEVGRVFSDHARGIRASAEANEVIVLADFSQFDSSEKWENVRKYMLEALVDSLRLANIQGEYGPWPSIADAYTLIWERMKHAKFEDDENEITTNQVASGEYMTIVINNFTNLANRRNTINEMIRRHPDIMKKLREIDVKFMGDDSQQIFETAGMLTSSEIDALNSTMSEVAAANGMDLNKLKTSWRYFYYEYLKKRAEYGWVIPRLFQLQILGSERVNFRLDFQTVLRGYLSLVSEFVSRGGDHSFCVNLCAFVANLKRKVKMKRGRVLPLEFERVPMSVVYMPVGLGGVGALPWTLLGANKDALMYLRYNRVMRERINQTAALMDFDVGPIRQEIASDVLAGDSFSKGIHYLKTVQDGERMLNALDAQRYLARISVNLGRFNYQNAAKEQVRASIEDNPKIFNIVAEEKVLKAVAIRENKEMLSKLKISHNIINVVVEHIGVADDLVLIEPRGDVVPFTYADYVRDMIAQSLEVDESVLDRAREVITDGGKIPLLFSTEARSPGALYVQGGRRGPWKFGQGTYDTIATLRSAIYSSIPHVSSDWVRDRMEEEFGWLRGVKMVDQGVIPYTLPVCPIAGLSLGLKDMVRRVGVSSEGDQNAVRINKLLIELARDPLFPSHLRTETVFEIIANPSIANDPLRVAMVLQAMGAAKTVSLKIAREMHQVASNFSFINRTQSYSTADQIIGLLDLGLANYNRLTSVDALDDPTFEQVLRSLALLKIVCEPDNLPRRFVKVMINGDGLTATKEKIMGALFEKVNAFQDIYPHGLLSD
jgi:hypothetical protein